MFSFNGMTLGKRLGLGFGGILVLLALITGISITRLTAFNDSVLFFEEDRVPKMLMIGDWQLKLVQVESHAKNMLFSDDATSINRDIDLINKLRKERSEFADKLKMSVVHPDGVSALKQVLDARANYLPLEDEYLKLILAGNKSAAKELLQNKYGPALALVSEKLEKLADLQHVLATQSQKETVTAYTNSLMQLLGLSCLALVLGIVAAALITRSIKQQLGAEPTDTVRIANRIAQGDLTENIQVKAHDKSSLLFAIKNMRDNLRTMVSDVRTGTETIATASEQIAAGNIDLSSRTEQQAGSLEETASSMEELTSTVKQNFEHARHANQMASSASEIASEGGKIVGQVVQTMGSINESSKKIVDIISVIDGIAFQTNILALNAAVEAARAGEQGRGFAVVATEVRNLAQRSAAAAKEIKVLINDSVDQVQIGSHLVDRAGSTMQEVVKSVQSVNAAIVEITTASQEQTSGIEQINQAVMQMDNATQQSAAQVEEVAAAASSLQEQAHRLAQMVSIFKIDATDLDEASSKQQAVASARQVEQKSKVVALQKRPSSKPELPNPRMHKRLSMAGAGVGGDWEEF